MNWESLNIFFAGLLFLAIVVAFIPRGKGYDPIKRMVDLVVSIPAGIVSLPIILVAALAIKFDSKGPVFYLADRVGANGRRIKVWKLRTMIVDADRESKITGTKDSRITRVGKFLRGAKIDELPQIINVIAGTMSIVGPRPESTNIVERYYNREDEEVFEIAPGLTCPGTLFYYIYDSDNIPLNGLSTEEHYAQVSLRKKLAADLHYVRHRCFAYDIKLIFLTCVIIIAELAGGKLNWLPDNMRAR